MVFGSLFLPDAKLTNWHNLGTIGGVLGQSIESTPLTIEGDTVVFVPVMGQYSMPIHSRSHTVPIQVKF